MLTRAGCLAVLLCLDCVATDLAAAPRLAADANEREVGSFAAPARSTEVNVQVIPAPSRVTAGQGTFTVTERTPIVAAAGESERIGRYLADLVARTRGIHLPVQAAVAGAPRAGRIELQIDPSIDAESAESYTMDVSPLGVLIRAREARGLFYGAITFWSLVTGAPQAGKSAEATIDAVRISDAPRFPWRGFMLDSARHYQPPAFIKAMLDWMALHKLNTFHWHLTDDQAWRLQINKYPRLTEVGAWRVPAGAGAAADIDPATGKPRLYGGYYTQDEVREIVAYAADRFITVVPEIEMPGHAQAALAAYPELGTDAVAPPVSSDWGVHTYLYNPDDATFAFLEDVLTEVMALFPGQYIHVGGDEAVKDRWRASPAVQERMRALGVPNEAALQGYFTHRIENFLSAHGRKLIGWDEILEGGLPPAATVMSWRGTAGAIEASKQGHDVVLAPAPTLYLDYLQSDLPDEPSGRPTYVTLRDMYAFNPLPAEIQGDAARHVLGAQINAWTEHMRTTERVEHAAFPRMAAFAEVVWTAPANAADRWPSFVMRLPAQFARYQKLGIHYADSVFAVKFAPAERAELSNQINIGEIRYTLDGSVPTRKSKLYTSPLTFKRPTTVTAATFLDGKRVSEPRSRRFDRLSALHRMDTELKSCANKLVLRLEDDAPINGARAMFTVDILDPCWIWEKADLARVTGIAADVGQVPFNFQVGEAVKQIPLLPPQTPAGELEVRQDSCDGPRIAVLPLAPAESNAAVTALPRVPLSREARGGGPDVHDLCLRFTRRSVDPIWTLQSVQLFE